jgi:hypothetical protein
VFRREKLAGSGLAFFSLGIQEPLSGAALVLPRAKAVSIERRWRNVRRYPWDADCA